MTPGTRLWSRTKTLGQGASLPRIPKTHASVKLQPVLKQWLERQYVPEGPVHSRFAQEAEDIVVSGS